MAANRVQWQQTLSSRFAGSKHTLAAEPVAANCEKSV
jgi:hypothetical protein